MPIRIHSVSPQFAVQITASHVAIVVLVAHPPDGSFEVPGASYFSGSSMSCNVSWERSQYPSPRDPLSRSFAMRRAIRALAALGLLAGAVVTAFAVAGPAAA